MIVILSTAAHFAERRLSGLSGMKAGREPDPL